MCRVVGLLKTGFDIVIITGELQIIACSVEIRIGNNR
jgi:hypothetical protein